MSDITVDFAQYTADTTLNGPYDAGDNVTLADDSSVLDELSDSDIDGLATNNVDMISATDGVLSWTADQYSHLILGPVTIDPDTFAIMADTGADIAALSAEQIAAIAAEGVAVIDPTDSMLSFTVDQFDALGAMSVDASANFTIADTGANLATMSAGQISSLASLGVDHIDATDNMLSLSIAQYQALGTVTLTAADVVTLADTGANLDALTTSDYSGLHGNGIDVINATDGAFTLSLAEYNDLNGVTLTLANTVTLADTGAALGALTTGQIDALGTAGIDVFNATDGALSLTVAQYEETATDNIALTAGNTVTLADTGAAIAGLTASQITALANVDIFDATDNALTFNVDQLNATTGNNIALTAADTVTISDTAAHLGTLTFSALAGENVDVLDATTAYTTLTVANLTALGTVTFSASSVVTLTDTGAAIAAVSDFSVFAAHGVDVLNASDDTLTISVAQFGELGTTTLTAGDTVTISDTSANLETLTFSALAAANVDALDATDAISITVQNITNLGAVHFTADSSVTLADTGAHISAVADFTTYGTHGVDTIDASNNTLTINTTQFGGLGSVTLTAGDTVTISDTSANLSGLSFSTLAGLNVDFLNSTNAYTTLTVTQLDSFGALKFTAASSVTLTDTSTNIEGVSDFTTFATHGVDVINASDDLLSISVSQFSGLGTTHLTGADVVTIADAAATLDTFLDTSGTATKLLTNGVNYIHATEGSISVDAAAFNAVQTGGAVFTSGDTVTVADTGANIVALDFTTLASTGVDALDATDNVLTLSADQYLDIAGVITLATGDTVTVADSASNLEALTTTDIGGLAGNNVDAITSNDGGNLDWSVAQWQALGSGVTISNTDGDLLVSDSESNIEALSGSDFASLATKGAQFLAADNETLNLNVSQVEGFLGTGLAAASYDTVTLVDTGSNIAAMTATQFGELAAAGIDTIDASNDTLSLTAAQISALGIVDLTDGDTVTLSDTGAHIAAIADFSILSAHNVDKIDATDNTLTISAAQYSALGTVTLTAGDSVTISDTAANLGALTYSALAGENVDFLNATTAINVTVQNVTDLGAVHFTAPSVVTLADTGADIEALSSFATLGTHGVDTINATDDVLSLTIAQMTSLGTVTLTAADTITLADTQSAIQTLSGSTILGYINKGVDFFHSTSGTLTVSTSQLGQFIHDVGTGSPHVADWEPRAHFTASDTVTWASTGSDIALNSGDVLNAAMRAGVDIIDATDNALTLDTSQFLGVTSAGTHFTVADDLTISDDNSGLATLWSTSGLNTQLSSNGVDTISSGDGFINITAQGADGVEGSGTVLDSGLTDTLADTGANIAAMTTDELSDLSSINVTTIDASDDTLSISLDQYNAIEDASINLTAGDNVTVTGNLDDLLVSQIANFGTNNVDHLIDVDGFSEVIWTTAQWNALASNVTIDNNGHQSGLNFVFDSAANLSAVTVPQITAWVSEGAEIWETKPPGDSGIVTWTVAKMQAMGASVFSGGTNVTISDTAAHIEAVSDFSTFFSHGVDIISASDGSLSLTAAQFGVLDGTVIDGANTLTLADTASNLNTYFATFLSADSLSGVLGANGVDTIHATGGAISVTAQAATGVEESGAVFSSGDTVTVADTGANLDAFIDAMQTATADLATLGIDALDATDNTLTLTASEFGYLAGNGVTLTAADTVTLADSAAHLEALTTTQIGALADSHVDAVSVAFGGDLDWTVAQWQALPNGVTIGLAITDTGSELVVFDTQTNIQNLTHSEIVGLVAQGATELAASDGVMNLTVDQVTAFLDTALSAALGDTVTISDTGAHIDALTAIQLAELTGSNIDGLFANDGAVTFSTAQFNALGVLHVADGNTFTVADTETALEAMGTDGYTAMASAGVDVIHSTTGSLTVTFDEFSAIYGNGVSFAAGDTVTLTGSQADIFGAQSGTYFAGLGGYNIDTISITGGTATLSVDQWNGLQTSAIGLDPSNDVTLDDTAANLSDETTTQIGAMSGQIDHWDVSDGQTLVLSKAQLDALSTATIGITPSEAVVLFSDTETTVEGLTVTQLEGYITQGVNAFRAGDTSTLNLSAAQITAVVDHGAYFVPANAVTLSDTATAIGALTATQFGELVTGYVDAITTTTGTLHLSVADFEAIKTALNGSTLTLTNAATLSDTATNLEALTTTEIGQLFGDNITNIAASSEVDWTQAQVTALGSTTVTFSSGSLHINDTEAHIEAVSTGRIDADHASGVTVFHSTDVSSVLNFTVAQAQHIVADSMSADNDTVTVTDTGANISTLTTAQLSGLGGAGIDEIVVTTGDIVFTVAQLNADTTDTIKASGGHFQLLDTEAHLEANTVSDFTRFVNQGIDQISSADSDSILFSAAEATLFETHSVTVLASEGDLNDSGAHIDALTVAQITALAGTGFSTIDASDNAITFSVAQFNALGTVALTAGDTVTLSDTSTNLLSLDLSTLAGLGVDVIDATDNALTLTVAQYNALGTVALTAGDAVTISDTGSNITTLNFSTLAGKNIDTLDVTTPFSLSVARYTQMGAVKFAPADTITLLDTGANLGALTSVQIGALAGNGIDKIDASDNVLSLTAAQYNALGTVTLTAADTVTLVDTGAHLATLDYTQLAAHNIDVIDASDNVLSLTVAKFQSLGTVQLTQADVVTLADTGANIAALTSTQIGALAAAGIDKIDASNNVLSLSVAQFQALGSVTLTGSDVVTLLDTGADLQTLNFSSLASSGVDILDASDNVLTLTAAQFAALGTVALKSTDTVTLLDTGSDISSLTVAQFNALAAKGIDILDATDNAYSLNVNKVNGLGNLTLAANDTVTIQDSESQIESMTNAQMANAVTRGIDIIHANDSTDNMTVSQITPLLGSTASFAAGDTVTIVDTGANIAAMSATQFGQLAAAGIDKLHASDNALSLSVAQYNALGTVTLTAADTVTLTDAYLTISALSTTIIAGLAAAGVDVVQASYIFWNKAQFDALPGGTTLSATNDIVFQDTETTTEALTASQIAHYASLGVTDINPLGGALHLNVSQAVQVETSDIRVSAINPSVTDTGANISALTAVQIGALQTTGFTIIVSTSGDISFTKADFDALGTVTVSKASGAQIVLSDSETNLEGISASGYSGYASKGATEVSATGGTLNLTAAQAAQFETSGLFAAAANTVTLADTGAHIAALTSTQIGNLAAAGVDKIDASDNAITFSLAQYGALGTVALTQADIVTIRNDNNGISGMTVAQIQGLAASGIDVLESNSNNFSFSAAQAHALVNQTGGGTVHLASSDTFFVNDAGANVGGLSTADIAAFGGLGAGSVDIIGSTPFSFSVAQYQAAVNNSVTIDSGNNVTLADTGAAIAALTAVQIGALGTNGIDHIDASDDAITFTVAQVQALGAVTLTAADVITVSDTEAHIEALTNSQFTALNTAGVDVIHSSNGTLNLSVAQVGALFATSTHFQASDTVTVVDLGANISALGSAQIGAMAAEGIDKIDASDNALTLSIAQFNALDTVKLTSADIVTLADTGANISALSINAIYELGASGIDKLDATDNAYNLTAAQAHWVVNQDDGAHLGLSATDTVRISDTAANIAAISLADIAALGADGAGSIHLAVNNGQPLAINVAYYQALVTAGIVDSPANNVVLTDTNPNLRSLTVAQISALAGNGVDSIHVTGSGLILSIAQLNALGAVTLTQSDSVMMTDSAANIQALTATQFTNYITQGVDTFHAASGVLAVTEAQVAAVIATPAVFFATDTVTLSDTGSNIAALTSTQIGELAGAGVDAIDATNNTLTLNLAQFQALGTVTLSSGDTNTISDSFSTFFGMSTANITALGGHNISHLHSADTVKGFDWSVAQWSVLPTGITIDSVQGTVAVFDNPGNDQGLTVAQINAFHTAGMNTILDSQNTSSLSFSVAQTAAILTDSIKVVSYPSPSSTIGIVSDTGANLATLTTTQIGQLHAAGFASVDASDDAVSFTKAQLDAFSSGSVSLTSADTVTLADAESTLEGLTASQFTNYATQGVDVFHSNSSILSLNTAQVTAVLGSAASFKGTDAVTLADTGTNLSALTTTQLGQLAAKGVDIIDVTSGTMNFTAATYTALGPFTVLGNASLVDTGAAIDALTAAQLGALTGTGITHIDATDNALIFSGAQADAVMSQTSSGTVSLDASDTLTLSDTGANLATDLSVNMLSNLQASGISSITIDATDNVLTLTEGQYDTIIALSITHLTAGDFVTVVDTGADIATYTTGEIQALAANNIDKVSASDVSVTLNISQLNQFSTSNVQLDQTNTITLSDTAANIQALTATQLTSYVTEGVDIFSSTSGSLSMSKAQVAAVLATAADFAAGNTVTLSDTGANIGALTAVQFGQLASHGVDTLDASDNALNLTAAQYAALGATTLTQADTVTMLDTGAHIAALSAAQFASFAANGIDTIDATNNGLAISVAQYQALGATTLTQTDTVQLFDTGADLGALTATQISNLAAGGIDLLNASDNVLTLSLAQFNALGAVTLTGSDVVTLADTGASLASLTSTQVGLLQGEGIDVLHATDGVLNLTEAQYTNLHHVALTAADTVTIADTGANISALTSAQIGALAAANVDILNATDNAITFSLAQYQALGAVHLSADDVITVNGTANTDLIDGQAGSQVLNGAAGDDVLFGEAGNDTLDGGLGNDTLNGGAGIDTVTYWDATAAVNVNLANGTATGMGNDILSSIENITGSNFADTLTGNSGNNVINGGAGNDTIIGGLGADTLTGGTGADHFVFTTAQDSMKGSYDTIMDFSHADGDKIDVSQIANFAFVSNFTDHADQLMVVNVGTNTYQVRMDVNGDGVYDSVIVVHSTTALVAGDFIFGNA
ncbi:MAG TPA: hypothetical protein VGG48_09250 [Rhizomicrobium sp.]|jgi:hypothetical protein